MVTKRAGGQMLDLILVHSDLELQLEWAVQSQMDHRPITRRRACYQEKIELCRATSNKGEAQPASTNSNEVISKPGDRGRG